MELQYMILLPIVAGAAFVQGFSGFGFGILVMALASLFGTDLERTSVFVTMTGIVLMTGLLIRSRRHMRVDWKQAGWLSVGILLTIPAGYHFILYYGAMPVFRVVFGMVLILFALHRMCRPHLKRHIPLFCAPLFGMVSGLLSGAFSSGGPPIVVYLYTQKDDPRFAVGTIQAVFLGGSLFRLATVLYGERGVSTDLLAQVLWMAPVSLLFVVLGFRLAHRVNGRIFLLAVYGVIVIAGIVNIIKGFSV